MTHLATHLAELFAAVSGVILVGLLTYRSGLDRGRSEGDAMVYRILAGELHLGWLHEEGIRCLRHASPPVLRARCTCRHAVVNRHPSGRDRQ